MTEITEISPQPQPQNQNQKALNIETAKVFAPLLKPARYKGAHGGRGSGKSHFFAELGVESCILSPGTRGVCIREVQRSLKESVKLLIEDKISAFKVDPLFTSRHDRIITPGNGIILFQGMQEHTKESIKSLEGFDWAYVEEAQTLTQGSLEMLRPTIRKPNSEIWFSWNPRSASDPVDALLRGENPPPTAVVVEANYHNNPFFPQVLEEEREFDEIHNPLRYGHVWDGQYEPQAIGAIFNRLNIHNNRRKEAPQLGRIVVAVDPAISSEANSDYTGIVVTARGQDDNRGYVLDDYTLKGPPEQWAKAAAAAYRLHQADAVVAEVNQGGDMVEHVLRSVSPNIKVIKVRATRGKHVRAEPISALYDLGRISHVGAYPQLEAEMMLMTAAGYEGEGSPNRVDAMVWGFTNLFDAIAKGKKASTRRPQRADSKYNPHRWRRTHAA